MKRIILDQIKRSSSFRVFLKTLLSQIFAKFVYSEFGWDHRCQFLTGGDGKVGLPGECLFNFLMCSHEDDNSP